MNKLGSGYNDDERGHYNFSFSDSDGKHISVSFRAEPDYDLNTIFNEFRNFLIASGHDIEGQIGELFHEEDEWEDGPMERTQFEPKDRLKQNQTQGKFTMDNLPNNGWPFGGLTTTSLAPISVTDLDTMTSHSYSDWAKIGSLPTMAPLTQEQIQSWSFSSADIKSLTVSDILNFEMPGTTGGAKFEFNNHGNDWSPRSKDYQK
jgi:hypothetical protein